VQIRPKILLKYGRINAPLRVPIFDLTSQPEVETYLITDTVAGLTTIKVKDPENIRIKQVALIGKEGVQGSEIVKTHASTYVSGQTVTLAAATTYPHSASTPVKILPYNQVELSWSYTPTGEKTVLVTTDIVAGLEETRYFTTTITAGVAYYFARFKNSVSTTYSEYSDSAPYSGYTHKSARSVIDSALSDINKKTSDTLSDEYAFQQINNCQEEVLNEMKRWSWMQEFDYDAGDTTYGSWKVALPTDCSDQNTNKSIWSFRIGTQPEMTWVDKAKWNEITYDIAHTTLYTVATAGCASVTLTSSEDFDDSGSFILNGWDIDYTSNNRTEGTLHIDGTLTTAGVCGADVFQGASRGTPQYWTTFGGYAYHYPITGSTHKHRNYFLDYYKSLTIVNQDSDEIVVPDPTVVQYYLEWKFLRKLNNGNEDDASRGAYNNYLIRREKLKQKEVLGKTFRLKPQINSLDMTSGSETREQRLGELWSE
jgi:hypothetical protein